MLAATFLFAAMAVFIKKAAATHSAGEIVFYRSVVTSFIAWVTTQQLGGKLRTKYPWAHFILASVGATSLGLYFFAMTQLALATAVTLNYMSSIWLSLLLLISAAMPGQVHLRGFSVAALALGFLGVVLVLRPTFESAQIVGAVCGLCSGLLAAFNYLLLGKLARLGEPNYRIVFFYSVGALAFGAVLATSLGWHSLSWSSGGHLLAVGLLGAGGQMLLTRAFASGDQIVSASLQYAGVGYALIFGVVFFDDTLSATSIFGIGLIVFAALWCIRLRSKTAL